MQWNPMFNLAAFRIRIGKLNSDQYLTVTPLHYAAAVGNLTSIEMIVEKGGNVNTKNEHDITPLHCAILSGHLHVAEWLLQHGSEVNCGDMSVVNSLHLATLSGNVHMVALLLKYGALINYGCPYGVCTSYHHKPCIDKKNFKIFQSQSEITPLHIAANFGFLDIVEILLNHGAFIDSVTCPKRYTPLYCACKSGHEDVVYLLIKKGANINIRTKHNTPLHIATTYGRTTIVDLLLKHKATVDNVDNDGKTALQIAVEENLVTIIEHILKCNPDINNLSNRNTVKIAALSHRTNSIYILRALLDYGFKVNTFEGDNAMLLHAAVDKGSLVLVEELLKLGANVNAVDPSAYKGYTPLHTATITKKEELVRFLLSHQADTNIQDRLDRKTPIFYAVEYVNLVITKLLLEGGADVNIRDHDGATALHWTSRHKVWFSKFTKNEEENIKYIKNTQRKLAEMLLNNGINVDAKSYANMTALHYAAQQENKQVAEVLCKYKANVNIFNRHGETPLHISAQSGDLEIIKMLLKNGADVNAKKGPYTTALDSAVKYKQELVVKILLEYGAILGDNEFTPLHHATLKAYHEIVEIILNFDVDVDTKDDYGRTPLHFACQHGNYQRTFGVLGSEETLTTLLNHGADINITDMSNRSPVSYAQKSGSLFQILNCHLIKMKVADLYLSSENILSISLHNASDYKKECEGEITKMKNKIIAINISYYDVLKKDSRSLAKYMNNKHLVQVLKSEEYKALYPTYASMIEVNFKKAMIRKEVLDDGKDFRFFLMNTFSDLPYDCIERILDCLSVKDLKILIGIYKKNSINNPKE